MGCFPKTWMLPCYTSLRPFSACASPMAHRVPRDPTRFMDPRRGPGTVSTWPAPTPCPFPTVYPRPGKPIVLWKCFLTQASVLFPALFPNQGDPHSHGLSDDIDSLSKSSSDTPTRAGRGAGHSRLWAPAGTWWDLALTAGVGVIHLCESSPAGQIHSSCSTSKWMNKWIS